MKGFWLDYLLALLDVAAQGAFWLWLFVGIPWLYSHYGPWGDWWVFFLAMSVFTVPLLAMVWVLLRKLRAHQQSLRKP